MNRLTPTLAAYATGRVIAPLWVSPSGRAFYPIAGGSQDPTPSPDPAPEPKADDPKTFTQADVDRIIAGRLSKYSDYDQIKQQVADLSPMREQFNALAKAFGVKPDKGAETTDVLKQVQDQLATMQRENAVLALANERGITEKADLDLLKQSRLEGDALTAMADRLKPTEEAAKPGTPKPDATQGAKGDPAKPDPGPGLPRLAAAYAASETTGTT